MRKLLRANLSRLWRSKVLWLCAAAAFIMSAAFLVNLGIHGDTIYTLDEAVMQVFPFMPVIYAVFVGMFLGTEYQDGTMRNKIIVGHSRREVYLTGFAAALVGCLVILLAWALSFAVGVVQFGWFTAPWTHLLVQAAAEVLITAAVAGILTLLCTLSSNKAASAVIAILLMFLLIVMASSIYNALCEPEFVSFGVYTENGVEIGDAEPNPAYVSGVMREIYEFAVNVLPSGQGILLANEEFDHPVLSICASACIMLLTTVVGTAAFKRKNLK